MKRLVSLSLAVLITVCMVIATERRAYGYVDPGSGLIALQTFASVVAAYAYFIRRRLRSLFTRKSDGDVVLPVPTKAGASREIA